MGTGAVESAAVCMVCMLDGFGGVGVGGREGVTDSAYSGIFPFTMSGMGVRSSWIVSNWC